MQFWDPLGLSKDIDRTTFEQRREAELKHGRVAMLAVVGLVIQVMKCTLFCTGPNTIVWTACRRWSSC